MVERSGRTLAVAGNSDCTDTSSGDHKRLFDNYHLAQGLAGHNPMPLTKPIQVARDGCCRLVRNHQHHPGQTRAVVADANDADDDGRTVEHKDEDTLDYSSYSCSYCC